jgi:hypothetical protein
MNWQGGVSSLRLVSSAAGVLKHRRLPTPSRPPVSLAHCSHPALFVACDFSDEVDDPPPELEIFDAQEGLGERKPLARGEEVGHIGW